MVGLLDIRPQPKQVAIGDDHIDVFGISIEGIAVLWSRFPIVMRMMSGSGSKPADLIKEAPGALAAIIAAACGLAGNEEAERKAASLPLAVQTEIIDVAWKETFPGGYGPFVQRLLGVANAVTEAAGKATAGTSPSQQPNLKPTSTQKSGNSPPAKSPPISSSKANSTPENTTSASPSTPSPTAATEKLSNVS